MSEIREVAIPFMYVLMKFCIGVYILYTVLIT